jgi:hypothetical protein
MDEMDRILNEAFAAAFKRVFMEMRDEDGSNPTIYVEPVTERKTGDKRDKNPWSNP